MIFFVSHTHWDREWYRTFQTFRARLVDTIDRVLGLLREDPGFRFLFDGQSVVIEDYLEVRPARRAELEDAVRNGRIAIGPWYVQPDSLLPSGEAHVRNLLEGKRVAAQLGPVSIVAYTPDSFGHPAQFPQLFTGFGLGVFVYWRGNGNEIDSLPSEYVWQAPDGSSVTACLLREGYFSAFGLPRNARAAARWLATVVLRLAQNSISGHVLLMNGIDHAMPDPHTAAVADALAQETGEEVCRALLDDFARTIKIDGPVFRGELIGARIANLLPGVWSTRTWIKLRNRRAEALLESWAEPWCALGAALGLEDERASLRAAWRELLKNQAHDSICGCSIDSVHEQMKSRYDTAEEIAVETTRRVLDRLAGGGAERRSPWSPEFEIAVFNPSPHSRSGVVRFPLEPTHWLELGGDEERELSIHPWMQIVPTANGFTVNSSSARLVRDLESSFARLLPDVPPAVLEFVAVDVPAFGWRRYRVTPSAPQPDEIDDGREISTNDLAVSVADDGTFTLQSEFGRFTGLGTIEDVGDRGDTYDFDVVEGGDPILEGMTVVRQRHASGIQQLTVTRTFFVPAGLLPDRRARSAQLVPLRVKIDVRLAAGVKRVDLVVRVANRARDHRLRLLFPTARSTQSFLAATTFDVTERSTSRPDDSSWLHPAPATFPHHGFVHAGGLTVCAPGLPEAEVKPDGTIAITLLRCVGWLARMDLRSRPEPAGPCIPTPGAQCEGVLSARMSLFPGIDLREARDSELDLWAVACGPQPILESDRSLLEVEPRDAQLSALKPAEDGPGFIARLLNPTDAALRAIVRLGIACELATPVRLDETPCGDPIRIVNGAFEIPVPPHALRSVRIT